MPPLLEMRGISKRFPGVIALEGVHLEVYSGEVVALIGENGAGKSTLMKILGGVERRDAGDILLDGKSVDISSPREASLEGIEFIHQELSVLDNLDVAANIFLRREPTRGSWLRLIDRGRIYAAADEQLRKVGLDLSSRTATSRLSIAQRQLVEIARALSAGARIIIMDEPTSSLTLTETRRLLELIRDLKSHGVAVIYISHRLDEVQQVADRVVGLRDGRNAGLLNRQEIENNGHDRMVRLMVGRDLKDFYVHRENGKDAGNQRTASDNTLSVGNLRTLRFPKHAVSFEARAGEVLGLAGLVGSGRSELARALFGVDAVISSEFQLGGRPLKVKSPREAISSGIYLIPEDRRGEGLIVDFNIRENITLPELKRYARGSLVQTAKETETAERMCNMIRIKTPSPEMRAANLSGGNQQKVVLAKWLALSPRVIIFDEPTRGIDVGAKSEIYSLIRDLADRGVAIIAISSDMEEVLGISDRIAVMHEGRLRGILTRPEFSEEAVMRLATGA
jgi:ribose transport system ATP-binding protein